MRKLLLVGLLCVALVAVALAPFTKSHAAQPAGHVAAAADVAPTQSATLPDYDIRLAGRGEFADYDLNPTGGKQAGAASAAQPSALRARATAVDEFRAALAPAAARNLHAQVNEAGALKNLFIDGAALSAPQTGAPDMVARDFLRQNAALFALSDADVNDLTLVNEDNDAGTTFLSYAQTLKGIKVFEGEVRVVVNGNGEVLSVREGFLAAPQSRLTPVLSEAQGIAKAFEYSGRTVLPAFAELSGRVVKGGQSKFANPLSADLADVLSELNVVRVGEKARLAWHVYADAGPNEWYETLVDARSGELLYRRNLYVFEAQGT
ncbi:MAG TPA: hypothetical protein VE775_02405, partial [Pyrinomonadaceae bacterium]|nr:hypothetical protein [Pyrinomonadaceae bacterium]